MKLRRPSHGTVIAYVALFVALGGSAYAVSRVDSRDVADNSLRSKDLRDRKAVANRDVRPDSLTGKVIREGLLDAREFVTTGSGGVSCGASCAEVTVDVPTRTRALVIGTGSVDVANGQAQCRLVSTAVHGSTNVSDADSFAVAAIHELQFGRQAVRLECDGATMVHSASITVLGLGRFE